MKKYLLLLSVSFSLFFCTPKNEKSKIQIKDSNYDRFWVQFYDSDSTMIQIENYVRNNKDTFRFQYKKFKNNKLDTIKSNFYTLDIAKKPNEKYYKGVLKLYPDKNLNNYRSKDLNLMILQNGKEVDTIFTFKSKNTDTIAFKYESFRDTAVIGLLIETITIDLDTIVNNKPMVRIIEKMYPIDNKSKTDNIFIEAFEIDKIKGSKID